MAIVLTAIFTGPLRFTNEHVRGSVKLRQRQTCSKEDHRQKPEEGHVLTKISDTGRQKMRWKDLCNRPT